MSKLIQTLRIRKDRAEKLRDKMFELIKENQEIYKESELINFLIDEMTERIKADENGLYIEENEK